MSAPITVLTIEDGGSYKDKKLVDIKDILDDQVHKIRDGSILDFVAQNIYAGSGKVDVGNIGHSLCKIADWLLRISPQYSTGYRQHLYTNNSLFANIKFFPLGKPNMSEKEWKSMNDQHFGGTLPLWLYKFLSRAASATNHRLLLKEQIKRGSIPLVAGALEHWGPLLFEVYMNAEPEKREYFDRVEEKTHSETSAPFRIFRAESGKAMFYECKMIRTPIGNHTAEALAKSLSGEARVAEFLNSQK